MSAAIDDRRLTSRMLARWTDISDGKCIPQPQQITPETFGDDWARCALIELDSMLKRSLLLHIGAPLRNQDRAGDMPQILSDYADGSLLRLATDKLPAMLAKRGPITFGGTGVKANKAMLYRSILLPLAEDGEFIDHAIAAINFREISAMQEDSMDGSNNDPVKSFIAFSSRRVSFAPSVAKKPMQVTIR